MKNLNATFRFPGMLFLFGCLVTTASGQSWEDITGNIPGGAPIVQNGGPLASDGTNLYVNTGDGVVRTTNGTSFT